MLDKLSRILGKSIVWAFSGALFGGFFAGMLNFLLIEDIAPWLALILASTLSGMVISAFFGSMLVALGGSLTGILTAISYQILFADFHQPLLLLGIALVLGFVAGSFFTKREIRDSQPLAQTGTGLMAGLVSGPILYFIVSSSSLLDNHWPVSAIAVSLVGLCYVYFIKHSLTLLSSPMALKLGGPLVCGVIAVAVASVFWIIGESYLTVPELGQISRYQGVLDATPLGLLGGVIGGAFGGAMLEILGIRMEQHIS
ncbi:hypothetical protein [Thiolapillus brandeum]|uniref:Uncharacterized protein n=1 Tax=Thiolapillus brandeum TaxID=1076588 RepID=A0A7U6GJA9_9GAMM|nr:hypothetical protein [Thiolapillus brandeum]BAO44748.1 hypothetical protein TBH_C1832 [Thiolapillus brandeum]